MLRGDFQQIMSTELIAVTGGTAAGVMLAFMTEQLYLVPGLLILLPGFLEMRGNISGSVSARLSSGLFIGAVKPKVRGNRIIRGNIIAAIVLALVVSVVLGLAAFLASGFIFGAFNVKIILIAVIASLISNIIEIPLTIATTFWLFRHKYDPNNIMGPYVTTTGDIVSVFSLLLTIVLLA